MPLSCDAHKGAIDFLRYPAEPTIQGRGGESPPKLETTSDYLVDNGSCTLVSGFGVPMWPPIVNHGGGIRGQGYRSR
jgi:hypothetical protein